MNTTETTDIDQVRSIIQPGVYVLSRDVVNPKPDRRTKHDPLLAESWSEGSRWQVFEYYADKFARDGGGEFFVYRLRPLDARTHYDGVLVRRERRFHDGRVETSTHGAIDDDRARSRGNALLAALVPAPEPTTVRELLAADRHSPGSSHILEYLVREGRLSLDDVRGALEAYARNADAFYGIDDGE